MKNNNIVDHTFINKNIKNRIINYRVDNSEDEYYLLTNLTCSIDELKNLYWKRWQVEIHFKESKYNLSLKTLFVKKTNSNITSAAIISPVLITVSSSETGKLFIIPSEGDLISVCLSFCSKRGIRVSISDSSLT